MSRILLLLAITAGLMAKSESLYGDVTANFVNGLLTVQGDNFANMIIVTQANGRFEVQNGVRKLKISSKNQDVPFVQNVTGVNILSGGGNDYVITDSLQPNVACSTNLGEGNDKFFGGASADTVYGYLGDDIIFTGNGADEILGGEGKDELRGGAGPDRIVCEFNDVVTDGGDGMNTFYVVDQFDLNDTLYIAKDVDFQWLGSDIRLINNCYQRIRSITGNKILLKPNGKPITFEYRRDDNSPTDWKIFYDGKDALLQRTNSRIETFVIYHEMGHFWDTSRTSQSPALNKAILELREVGGWIRNPTETQKKNRVPSAFNNGWWRYDDDRRFPTQHSKDTVHEYHAAHFALFIQPTVDFPTREFHPLAKQKIEAFFDVVRKTKE